MSPAPSQPADELRQAARRLLDAVAGAWGDDPVASLHPFWARLRRAVRASAGDDPERLETCKVLDRLAGTSLRVLDLHGGSDRQIRRAGPWTLELTTSEVRRCLGELSVPSGLGATCRLLRDMVERNLQYYVLGDRDSEEFHRWFHGQYRAWLRIADNCRSGASDTDVPHPEVQMPFALPWERYDGATLGHFVGDVVRHLLGDEASMLTVIADGARTPFILYEQVTRGAFGQVQLFKARTVEQVRAYLAVAGLPLVYVKTLDIAHIRDIWRSARRYARDGNKRRHLLTTLGIFARHLGFDPLPPVALGLLSALGDVHAAHDAAPGLTAPVLPNLQVQVGDGVLEANMDGPLCLRVAGDTVLELVDALAHARGLGSVYRSGSALLGDAVAAGKVGLTQPGIEAAIVRLVARRGARRVPRLLRALSWSLGLLGSPLRIVVQAGSTGLLLHWIDGQLARVDVLCLPERSSLRDTWLGLCRAPKLGFVHFILRVPPSALQAVGMKPARRLMASGIATRRVAPAGETSMSWLELYPHHGIAVELVRQFEGLGLVNLLGFALGPPL